MLVTEGDMAKAQADRVCLGETRYAKYLNDLDFLDRVLFDLSEADREHTVF